MPQPRPLGSARRGITVLTLLLLIVAAIIAAVFLVRYLHSRPAVSMQQHVVRITPTSAHQPFEQLYLPRVI
jgi:hypothetical protein